MPAEASLKFFFMIFEKLLLKKQFLLLSTKTMSSTGVEKYSILERLNKLNEWIEISEEGFRGRLWTLLDFRKRHCKKL